MSSDSPAASPLAAATAAPSGFACMGVVGTGVMGKGIAQIAAQAGLQVLLFDARPQAAQDAVDDLGRTLARLAEKGKLSAEALAKALANLRAVSAVDGLAPCDLVVEAIAENIDAKRQLFSQLEGLLSDQAVLATNTSSLSVTAIAAGLRLPQRVAGFHFFNPVPLMKIVEVIDGLLTDRNVSERLLALGREMGHTAVRAQDTPGFIVNHAGRGYGTESLRLLAEGVGSIEDIDRVLRETAGFRLGPFELMDLTGLDVSHPVMESIYHQYYEEPRFRPQPLTRQMLGAGVLGRKTGRGFYRYNDAQQERSVEAPTGDARPARVWVSRKHPEGHARAVALLEQLGATIDAAECPYADSLCIVTPLGEDATSLAVAEGLDPTRTIALDTLFDTSRRRVLAATPVTTLEARAQARGLFGADGVPVTLLLDSAALVAARVVATIVNIASEMAQHGVAAPADIDRAVQLGLGYPWGPLAWGDRLGAGTVLTVLEQLHASTGDPRYRPSPWLRRRAQLGLSLLTQDLSRG